MSRQLLQTPGRALRRVLGLLMGLSLGVFGLWFLVGHPGTPADSHDRLRVMTYSSFMSAWGPGPEIAKQFRAETGVDVEFQDAGDAGLLLEKLKLFSSDVVVGLDRWWLPTAREKMAWRPFGRLFDSHDPSSAPGQAARDFRERDFVAYDWAPLAFVYRKGEIAPPTGLHDLLDRRFAGQIALEDPRTSTPGLEFLLWVLDAFGEDGGFQFLTALKANIRSISPSWSTAYGTFTKKQAALVLSYATSPIYHFIEEKNPSYAAAVWTAGHPVQVEYAGIPANCARCGDAEKFVRFLLRNETQSLIMKKNFMMPISSDVADSSPFASVNAVPLRELKSAPEFMKRRDEIFETWRKLGL